MLIMGRPAGDRDTVSTMTTITAVVGRPWRDSRIRLLLTSDKL